MFRCSAGNRCSRSALQAMEFSSSYRISGSSPNAPDVGRERPGGVLATISELSNPHLDTLQEHRVANAPCIRRASEWGDVTAKHSKYCFSGGISHFLYGWRFRSPIDSSLISHTILS
jgi:hypothetical protein